MATQETDQVYDSRDRKFKYVLENVKTSIYHLEIRIDKSEKNNLGGLEKNLGLGKPLVFVEE